MGKNLKIIFLIFTLAVFTSAATAGIRPETKKEIDHLIQYLGKSGCSFNRNDTWFTAKEAVGHITTKYNYLLKRNLVSSAEQFIDRAASQSSFSGKSYQVKCGNAIMPSKTWFYQELERFRGSNIK